MLVFVALPVAAGRLGPGSSDAALRSAAGCATDALLSIDAGRALSGAAQGAVGAALSSPAP